MSIINSRQIDNYFTYRNISEVYYESYKLAAYIRNNLPADKDARILEIGCGFGQILHELVGIGFSSVEGIDISREAVEICKTNKLNVSLIGNIDDFCSASKIKYDFIIMSHVLEHININDIVETLTNIRTNLMAEGSSFLIMVPNAQSNTGCYWAYEDFTHHTLFTAGSIEYVLRAAGFKSIKLLDRHGLDGTVFGFKAIKWCLLMLYVLNYKFWNYITSSSFHRPSPQIFTYEIKVLAK
jgi:cyclopropane fatty-acyl-phospholipid synthase-like methyltransferase